MCDESYDKAYNRYMYLKRKDEGEKEEARKESNSSKERDRRLTLILSMRGRSLPNYGKNDSIVFHALSSRSTLAQGRSITIDWKILNLIYAQLWLRFILDQDVRTLLV